MTNHAVTNNEMRGGRGTQDDTTPTCQRATVTEHDTTNYAAIYTHVSFYFTSISTRWKHTNNHFAIIGPHTAQQRLLFTVEVLIGHRLTTVYIYPHTPLPSQLSDC